MYVHTCTHTHLYTGTWKWNHQVIWKAGDWSKRKMMISHNGSPAEVPRLNILFQLKKKYKCIFHQLCFILTFLWLTSSYFFKKLNCFTSFFWANIFLYLTENRYQSYQRVHLCCIFQPRVIPLWLGIFICIWRIKFSTALCIQISLK